MNINQKIIIDASKGGEDIGNSDNGIIEKDYNLAIARYINDRLKALGISSYLTRDSDETIDMNQRIEKINSLCQKEENSIVISNSLKKGSDGTEIVYALRSEDILSKIIAQEIKKTGINVPTISQKRLPTDITKDYHQIIRETNSKECIIIYYGNVDLKEEAKFLRENIENLGEAVVKALSTYLNINYLPLNQTENYTVHCGDSLYSIAKKYNIKVDDIKKLNNLSSNLLKIGQNLKISSK